MPMRRDGYNDSLIDARLLHLTGTTYPAPPAGLYIALLSGDPLSDGSGVTNEIMRVGPVTFTAPATPSGDPGWPHTRSSSPLPLSASHRWEFLLLVSRLALGDGRCLVRTAVAIHCMRVLIPVRCSLASLPRCQRRRSA
jgi:hypothetical protein